MKKHVGEDTAYAVPALTPSNPCTLTCACLYDHDYDYDHDNDDHLKPHDLKSWVFVLLVLRCRFCFSSVVLCIGLGVWCLYFSGVAKATSTTSESLWETFGSSVDCVFHLRAMARKQNYRHPHHNTLHHPQQLHGMAIFHSRWIVPLSLCFNANGLRYLFVCQMRILLLPLYVMFLPTMVMGERKFRGSIQVVHGINNLGTIAIGE